MDKPLNDEMHSVGHHVLHSLDFAAKNGAPLSVRFACLVHKLTKAPLSTEEQKDGTDKSPVSAVREVCERLRVPNDCKELATTMEREWRNIHASPSLDAEGIVQLLERCDALRKPERFSELLLSCEYEASAYFAEHGQKYTPRQLLEEALEVVRVVDVGAVARDAAAKGIRGSEIGSLVHEARILALKQHLQST